MKNSAFNFDFPSLHEYSINTLVKIPKLNESSSKALLQVKKYLAQRHLWAKISSFFSFILSPLSDSLSSVIFLQKSLFPREYFSSFRSDIVTDRFSKSRCVLWYYDRKFKFDFFCVVSFWSKYFSFIFLLFIFYFPHGWNFFSYPHHQRKLLSHFFLSLFGGARFFRFFFCLVLFLI